MVLLEVLVLQVGVVIPDSPESLVTLGLPAALDSLDFLEDKVHLDLG